HAPQNCHTLMEPVVVTKIPGRNEKQSDAAFPVLARKRWKVHVLADGDSPQPGRALQHLIVGAERVAVFKHWYEMVFFVVCFELPVRDKKQRIIPALAFGDFV